MRRIVVDGHNLLHGTSRYAAVMARDIDAARDRLIADLGARVAEGQDITVVFDGAGNPFSDGTPELVGGVTVIYSPAGIEADAVIEAIARAAREAGEEVEVVTSDGATRGTSAGGSVTVRRSPSFASEIAEDEKGWREKAGAPRSRVTVSDRLDPATRAKLDRLSKGGHAVE